MLRMLVEHLRGVEGAGHTARPALTLEQPPQQDGVDLVRVDDVAVLVDRADAVGVAVSDQAGVALFFHDDGLRQRRCAAGWVRG